MYLNDLYLHILVSGRSIETVADGLNYVVNKAAVWVVDISCVPSEVAVCNEFLTRKNTHTQKKKLQSGNTIRGENTKQR